MAKLAALPFGDRQKKDIPLRRRFAPSTKTSTSITKTELSEFLKKKAEGGEIKEDLQSKFDAFMAEGVASHLGDNATRGNMAKHIKDSAKDADGAALESLVGEQSVFFDYVSGKTKAGSVEQGLMEYILTAVQAKKDGKNIEEEPVSLASESLATFANDLVDKDKGLSIRSSQLDRVKKSSDPIVKALFNLANDLGLSKSIAKTNEDLKAGVASDYSTRLAESAPEMLRKETEKLKTVLPQDGSLVVSVKGKTVEKVEKITLNSAALGDDSKAFNGDEELDFGKFFNKALTLSTQGDEKELKEHVANGLSLIYTHFKQKMKEADGAEAEAEVRNEFNKVANAIQGKGLLPERVAKVVRDVATEVIPSKEFSDRVSAGDEDNLTTDLVEDFFQDLGSKDFRSLTHIGSLATNGSQVEIIDPENFGTSMQTIEKVENNQLSDSQEIEENRDISGNKITVQRAVEAYAEVVDNGSEKVANAAREKITGNKGAVNLETLAKRKEAFDKSKEDTEITSKDSLDSFLSENINEAIKSKVTSKDDEKISNALKATIEKVLDKKGSRDKTALWKDNQALKSAVDDLVLAIQTGKSDVDGDGNPKPISDAVKTITQALQTELGGQEEKLVGKFIGPRGEERIDNIFDGVHARKEDALDFSKVIDLEKVMDIFEGQEGKKLQKALEDLSYSGSKFSDIRDNPESVEFGEFNTLLNAKTGGGSIDEDKRLTALLRLIQKAAGGNNSAAAAMTSHVVEKLKGSDINSDSQATRIARQLNDSLGMNSQDLDLGNLVDAQGQPVALEGFIDKTILASQQRNIALGELYTGMRRQLDNIRTHFIANAMDKFADREKAVESKGHLEEIQSNQDGIDRNDPEAIKEFKSKLSDKALEVFTQLEQGLATNPLKRPKYVTEHPGDIMDRIVNFVQNLLFQPAMALLKGKEDAQNS